MSYKEYTVKVWENYVTHWYLNGKLHREDGPSIEYATGDTYWHRNGNKHREDGPAVEYENGYKAWYLNGKRHREDGPAVEYPDGSKEWWVDGVKYSEEAFEKKTQKATELTVADLEKLLGYPVKIVKE